MTHTAHTPGPWLYRPNKYDDWGVVKEGNNSLGKDQGYFVARAGYGGHLTLEIEHEHRKNGTDPYEANARLIAAAPELLEALESIRDTLNRNGYATEHADAAIAKARGQK